MCYVKRTHACVFVYKKLLYPTSLHARRGILICAEHQSSIAIRNPFQVQPKATKAADVQSNPEHQITRTKESTNAR